MLIEFSVANYRSFKEKVTFSMVAANLVAKDKEIDENNVFAIDDDLKLLKSAAIYGANASGKSNLTKALGFMRWFMVNSSKETQSTEKIGVERFQLSTETEDQPSFFEIIFLLDGQQYRYGFEANTDKVVSEWLFYVPKSRESKLFERRDNDISATRKYQAEGIEKRTRNNALFLSVSAQFNVKFAEIILDWLSKTIKIVSGLDDRGYQGYTISCLIDNQNKDGIIKLIKKLDLGIEDIRATETKMNADNLPDNLPDEIKSFLIEREVISIQTMHRKFNNQGKYISTELFDLDEQESEGTQKIFALAGPLMDTLKYGKVLIVDEFEARLHPLISRAIVELFNSRETNPNNAQLIFMTHDTNLLSNKLFRRDQIWFTEKDRFGSTDLYSLAEYKIRNDASFESDYIKGRYGAIPYLGDLSQIIESNA
ncbi:MAG: ATP-binding protein [Symploca sp. SIO2G7]|nr:ATP-binding protein [Symploca sp. SIO2G7]